jgi:hypothetical protein
MDFIRSTSGVSLSLLKIKQTLENILADSICLKPVDVFPNT